MGTGKGGDCCYWIKLGMTLPTLPPLFLSFLLPPPLLTRGVADFTLSLFLSFLLPPPPSSLVLQQVQWPTDSLWKLSIPFPLLPFALSLFLFPSPFLIDALFWTSKPSQSATNMVQHAPNYTIQDSSTFPRWKPLDSSSGHIEICSTICDMWYPASFKSDTSVRIKYALWNPTVINLPGYLLAIQLNSLEHNHK